MENLESKCDFGIAREAIFLSIALAVLLSGSAIVAQESIITGAEATQS